MSSYSELVKNFEKVRDYMREFYVYGFKSRSDYVGKSSRTYDDERRRMESWLGEHMSFVKTPEGKNVFISIDSRTIAHNPLYKAWKAKSFTDGDITLHFILFDIFEEAKEALSVSEIMEIIDTEYLNCFDNCITFDESTVRKKLKEYTSLGLVYSEKNGKKVVYGKVSEGCIMPDADLLHFFSEVSPCGVVGSFLLDKYKEHNDILGFKHHYITSALDSGILEELFDAMHKKCEISAVNLSRRSAEAKNITVVPLRIYISVQNGRVHLLAYIKRTGEIRSYRVDYLSDIKLLDVCSNYDDYRARLDFVSKNMWGVGCTARSPEKVSFTVYAGENEEHIVKRLEREKRCGRIEKLDDNHYRFSAELYDLTEIVPWIRTFICRIISLEFSDKEVEKRFLDDIEEMYRIYGIGGGDEHDI